ncbi:MAG: tetratricopeptide repeat protein [Gemmatimonadetes bacterium]|nr:tetratricopeptide repeat protein [Gemmatimonadota bacterium]
MIRSNGRTVWMLLSTLLVAPTTLSAQRGTIRVPEVRPVLNVDACSGFSENASGVLALTLQALTGDRSEARSILVRLQDSLSALTPARPTDVALQFDLALVMGARTEVEGGRDKLRTAEDLLGQVKHVLEVDPSHPGAQYLLGRLNAAVMRMSPISRFVATHLLGASALSGASWAEARRLLESAAEGAPCSPDAQYELARLYTDRGEPTLAMARLQRLLLLRANDPHAREVIEKGKSLLETLERR